MSQKALTTNQMAEISLLIAIAVVIELITMSLPLPRMPQGGSIDFTMLPLIIIAYRHGFKIGIIGGMIYSLLDLIVGGLGLYHWGSLFLDYLFAFGAMGLAALVFKINKENIIVFILGILLAGLVRFFFHFLSGVILFGEFAPDDQPVVEYSLFYNAGYMLPSIAITMLLGALVFLRLKQTLNTA